MRDLAAQGKHLFQQPEFIEAHSKRIKWGQEYTESEDHMWMPERGTKLYNWKSRQLYKDFDAKMKKEIKENEGGTLWRERKDRRKRCIAQKNASKSAGKSTA
jgi:hypothetical protein